MLWSHRVVFCVHLISLQSLTYDSPAALSISSSTMFLKVANETLTCSTKLSYYPDPEFTSFTATRTGKDVRITIQVIFKKKFFIIHIQTCDICSLKCSLCFSSFRKRQTSWRWRQMSYQCGAFKTSQKIAPWKPKKPVTTLTLSPVRLKAQPTLNFNRYW